MRRKRIRYKPAEVQRLFEACRPSAPRSRKANGRPATSGGRLPDWETLLKIDQRAEAAAVVRRVDSRGRSDVGSADSGLPENVGVFGDLVFEAAVVADDDYPIAAIA